MLLTTEDNRVGVFAPQPATTAGGVWRFDRFRARCSRPWVVRLGHWRTCVVPVAAPCDRHQCAAHQRAPGAVAPSPACISGMSLSVLGPEPVTVLQP